jgi:tRNA dimethylallyltransferase
LCESINKRVEKRYKKGIKKEIEKLLDSGVDWKNQAMDSLGYKQWKGYFKGKKTEKDVIEQWKKAECQYAKRQLTWFKKDDRYKWFNVFDKKYPKNVEKYIEKWYNSN